MTSIPTITLIQGFWAHLAKRRKRQLAMLLVLMILASFAEVLSLGAVLPFLGALTTPDIIFNYPDIQPAIRFFGIQTSQELLLPLTILFVFAALLAGGMRLLLLYANTKLSFAIGADFSREIYRRTLYQPYAVHVSRNSSEIISGIVGKANTITSGLLAPILTLISSVLILVTISIMLLSLDPVMSITAFLGFGLIYWVIIFSTRKRLELNSQEIAVKSTQVIKVLQEGLGGIRDVLIDGSQDKYCLSYRNADISMRNAQASINVIGGSPRFAAEALGMAFIAIMAYVMVQLPAGVAGAITTLGVLAVGAQRLLPVLQQGYSALVTLRSSRASLNDALELLSQPIDKDIVDGKIEPLPFDLCIELREVVFYYVPNGALVLDRLNLNIPKGSRVGFIGTTGSGKSTLLDIVMGLLTPSGGEVLVDGQLLGKHNQRSWQRHIAHVPQSIYLADSSVRENIAFGVPEGAIDLNRVKLAAQRAQIADYIEGLPLQYDTHVGERGVRLSGGQRQRIGIARALYKNADVIVFDEATSALDNETEHAVMHAIKNLGKDLTILIIAHRLSTLEICDQVVELDHGRVVRSGSYQEVVLAKNP